MGDLGKLIIAKGFKKLPKVQKIAQSGHTDLLLQKCSKSWLILLSNLRHCFKTTTIGATPSQINGKVFCQKIQQKEIKPFRHGAVVKE